MVIFFSGGTAYAVEKLIFAECFFNELVSDVHVIRNKRN